MPTVSIIITTYNYGQYLAQAIESALNQTYKDKEVLVIDDGSTDHTAEVIEPYKNKVSYYYQANAGVVVARNAGAARARGKYICFLDADDYLDVNYLEILLEALEKQANLRFAYGDIVQFESIDRHLLAGDWSVSRLLWSNFIGLCALIPREFFDQVGGYDMKFNRGADFEDWDFWLKMAECGFEGIYVPRATYFYRITTAVSRNRISLTKKISLRSHLIGQHASLYMRPRLLVLSPWILWRLGWKKLSRRDLATSIDEMV